MMNNVNQTRKSILSLPSNDHVSIFREKRLLIHIHNQLCEQVENHSTNWQFHFHLANLLAFTNDELSYNKTKEIDSSKAEIYYQKSLKLLQSQHKNDYAEYITHQNAIKQVPLSPPPFPKLHTFDEFIGCIVHDVDDGGNDNIAKKSRLPLRQTQSSTLAEKKTLDIDDIKLSAVVLTTDTDMYKKAPIFKRKKSKKRKKKSNKSHSTDMPKKLTLQIQLDIAAAYRNELEPNINETDTDTETETIQEQPAPIKITQSVSNTKSTFIYQYTPSPIIIKGYTQCLYGYATYLYLKNRLKEAVCNLLQCASWYDCPFVDPSHLSSLLLPPQFLFNDSIIDKKRPIINFKKLTKLIEKMLNQQCKLYDVYWKQTDMVKYIKNYEQYKHTFMENNNEIDEMKQSENTLINYCVYPQNVQALVDQYMNLCCDFYELGSLSMDFLRYADAKRSFNAALAIFRKLKIKPSLYDEILVKIKKVTKRKNSLSSLSGKQRAMNLSSKKKAPVSRRFSHISNQSPSFTFRFSFESKACKICKKES